MRSFAANHPRLAALLQFVALALAVASLVLIRAGTAPMADEPAQASADSTPTPVPLTSANCFGGVLADDPVHCRVLQGAHDQGVMTVEAMYEGGGALWIFVAEGAELDTVYSHIREAGHREYLADRSICDRYFDEAWYYYGCEPGVLSTRSDEGYRGWITALPPSERYDEFILYGGGSEARKQIRGWANLKEVWPTVPTPSDTHGGATSISVAGVDTATFPDRDCNHNPVSIHIRACLEYDEYPEYNIAGWADWRDTDFHVYVRPPSRVGRDKFLADFETELRRRFAGWTGKGNTFSVVPYKYDFDQIWRWAVLLDRFTLVEGNTVGIRQASVWYNTLTQANDPDSIRRGKWTRKVAYPVPDLPGADEYENPDGIRPTINLYTLDLDATVAALPELLPLLGIPVDAVGKVVERSLARETLWWISQ